MTCFPYDFPMMFAMFSYICHMFTICVSYICHMFTICVSYICHMFTICVSYVCHILCHSQRTGVLLPVKNLTGSNPNPTPTLQPWLLDSHGSVPDKKKT